MLKDMLREFVKERYKQLSPGQYLLLILVAVISPALVYAVMVPGGTGNAAYHASLNHSGDVKEMTKQAILEWMKENSEMPEQVLSKIYSAAMNSVNMDLILAICLVESHFDPHVESDRGAIGLMGIMPGVWLEELQAHGIVRGKEDLYTISRNIESGAYVLETYLERTNNLREALSRYAGGDPSYATRVLRMLRKIALTRSSGQQLALARFQE
jgi:soluble lytic murein transglycosylase-like protein